VSYDCFCDYDPATFYERRVVRARKPHKCEECNRAIPKGCQYEYTSGLWDGYFDTFKTCLACVAARQFVTASVPCFCWAHGNLHQDIVDTVSEARFRAPDEMRGVAFRLGRIVIEERRKMAGLAA
jgi:hypothetical protein